VASSIADKSESSNQAITEKADIKSDRVGSDSYKQTHMGLIFQEGLSFSGFERNKFFVGDGKGNFTDLSDVSGADSEMDCRAACRVDIDDDGDIDLFVNSIQRRTHLLYRNNLTVADRHVIKVRLRATTLHPDAIGSTVTLVGKTPQTRVLSCGSGFESQHTRELIFGVLDSMAKIIQVRWPGGQVESFEVAAKGNANSKTLGRYLLVEGSGEASPIDQQTFLLGGNQDRKVGMSVGNFLPKIDFQQEGSASSRFDPTGKLPTLINFWSTTCVPCLHELPDLAKLCAAGKYRVQLFDMDPPSNRARVASMLKNLAPKLNNEHPTADSLERLFGSSATPLPTSIILDPQGRIQRIIRGVVSLDDL
jgi:thiol-disulfide isomerase/thioredoxin